DARIHPRAGKVRAATTGGGGDAGGPPSRRLRRATSVLLSGGGMERGARGLRLLFPHLLDLGGALGNLPRGSLRHAAPAREGDRQGLAGRAGADRGAGEVRPGELASAGLEHPGDRLLSRPRCEDAVRLGDVPAGRRRPGKAGARWMKRSSAAARRKRCGSSTTSCGTWAEWGRLG